MSSSTPVVQLLIRSCWYKTSCVDSEERASPVRRAFLGSSRVRSKEACRTAAEGYENSLRLARHGRRESRAEHGGGEEEAIAALLHDIPEDCGGQEALDEIRGRFGKEVARIVEGCTDTLESPKPPWRRRKEEYIEHLAKASKSVLLVSAADKVHNARSILFDYREKGEQIWDRFSSGRDGQLWYYRELVRVFCKRGSSPLVDELDRVVTEIEELSRRKTRKVRH